MRKKTLFAALVMMLTLAFSSVALAYEIMPLWDYIDSCAPNLLIRGDTAYCTFDVDAANSKYEIKATVTLQKLNDSGYYGYVTGWSGLRGTGYLNFSSSYPITESGSYRIKCDVTVGTESVTFYAYDTKQA